MIQRCGVKHGDPNYLRKGIKVCNRWLGKGGYDRFLSDVGEPPTKEHSLDRYPDNNGNYGPGNVRWATATEQARNTSANRVFIYKGERKILIEIAEITGVRAGLISSRMSKGMSLEEAISAKTEDLVRRTRLRVNGATKTLAELETETGLAGSIIRDRLKAGFSVEEALALPKYGWKRGGRKTKTFSSIEDKINWLVEHYDIWGRKFKSKRLSNNDFKTLCEAMKKEKLFALGTSYKDVDFAGKMAQATVIREIKMRGAR